MAHSYWDRPKSVEWKVLDTQVQGNQETSKIPQTSYQQPSQFPWRGEGREWFPEPRRRDLCVKPQLSQGPVPDLPSLSPLSHLRELSRAWDPAGMHRRQLPERQWARHTRCSFFISLFFWLCCWMNGRSQIWRTKARFFPFHLLLFICNLFSHKYDHSEAVCGTTENERTDLLGSRLCLLLSPIK